MIVLTLRGPSAGFSLLGMYLVWKWMSCFSKGMDVLEDFTFGLITASALPPALNDFFVVPKDFDMSASGSRQRESEDEEPEADHLCPTNVPAISFPI